MKSRLKKIQFYCLILLFLVGHKFVFAQNNAPALCSGTLVEVLDGKLWRLQLDRASETFSRAQLLDTDLNLNGVNALGFRWLDQKFYGSLAIGIDTIKIFSLDLDGNYVIETSFVTERAYRIVSGAVTSDQKYLVLIEHRETDNIPDALKPTFLHKINLEDGIFTNERITLETTAADAGIFVKDIAFDPLTNIAYGYDSESSRITTIDINTELADNTSLAIIDILDLPYESLNSLFFDPFGRLLGASKTPAGVFVFEINKDEGTILNRYQEDALPGTSSFQDGCSCPFTVAMEQTLSKDTTLNCQELEALTHIAYLSEVNNNGLIFRDSFPPNCIVTEVLRNPYGGIVDGLGTNSISISNIFPSYGVDSIKLKLFIEEDVPEGNYFCQASLSGVDLSAVNDSRTIIYSDYPISKALYDPTPFFIQTLGTFSPQTSYELCANRSLTLKPLEHSTGLSFLWPDGSTTDHFIVDTPGSYDVVIGNDCSESLVTINVNSSLLDVSLGEDQDLFPGQSLLLVPEIVDVDFQSHTYQWLSNDTTALSCLTCAENLVTPQLETTIVQVLVSNLSGCVVEDEITIRLTRPVYFPTAFSPNKDGINDYFFAQTPTPVRFDYFRVFNRWGGLVFEQRDGVTNEEQNAWDGRKDGEPLENGIYVWTIALRYPGDVVEIVSGDVLLLD